jgi:hypothetical protein
MLRSLVSNPEIWAALIGAIVGGLIGVVGTYIGVKVQARISDEKDRESRLIAFSAFLARWRKMLDREMKRDVLQNEQNVLNYKGNLPEFDRQAVIVERDLAQEIQEPFRKLVTKAGSYSEGAIESQTRTKKLEILSDINQILSLIGGGPDSHTLRETQTRIR